MTTAAFKVKLNQNFLYSRMLEQRYINIMIIIMIVCVCVCACVCVCVCIMCGNMYVYIMYMVYIVFMMYIMYIMCIYLYIRKKLIRNNY